MKQAIGFDQPIPSETLIAPVPTPVAIVPPAPRNVDGVPVPLLPEQMVEGQEYVAYEYGGTVRAFQGRLKANPKICTSPIMHIVGRSHRMIRLEGKTPDVYFLGFEHTTFFYTPDNCPAYKPLTAQEIAQETVEYHSTYIGR